MHCLRFVLVEWASAFLKTLVVWSGEVLRRGAPGGENPLTEKVASSKQVQRCSVLIWYSCQLNRRLCPLNLGMFNAVH